MTQSGHFVNLKWDQYTREDQNGETVRILDDAEILLYRLHTTGDTNFNMTLFLMVLGSSHSFRLLF